jgi:Ca2+-binding RTX toxin-like protein
MSLNSQLFRRIRTAGLAATAAVIAIAALPMAASASKVSVGGGTVKYTGQGMEENNVGVSLLAGVYTVTDNGSGVILRVGRGCVKVSGDTATCADTGIKALSVVTGAREDSVAVDASVTVPAKLSGGAEQNMLSGGSGNDKIIGGSSEDILTGGLGSDKIIAGNGEDVINTNDGGIKDTLNCGGGEDILNTDSADVLAPNCP